MVIMRKNVHIEHMLPISIVVIGTFPPKLTIFRLKHRGNIMVSFYYFAPLDNTFINDYTMKPQHTCQTC